MKNTTQQVKSETVKYMPGPWQAWGCAVYTADKWHEGRNQGGKYICGIELNDGCAGPAHEPTDERLANARLIAAAPDLLEACKDVELRMTQAILASSIGRKKDRTPFLLGELERMKTILRAAIEKATQ